jgi:hypothetical protein
MKRIVQACATIVVMFTPASGIATPAGANASAYKALAKRLSQKSAEFVQINVDGKAPAQSPKVHLVTFYRAVSKKDAALHVANEV